MKLYPFEKAYDAKREFGPSLYKTLIDIKDMAIFSSLENREALRSKLDSIQLIAQRAILEVDKNSS